MSGMIQEGRIPMNEAESLAVAAILKGGHGGVTRTEPGETGPLAVTLGNKTWIVQADGKYAAVKG